MQPIINTLMGMCGLKTANGLWWCKQPAVQKMEICSLCCKFPSCNKMLTPHVLATCCLAHRRGTKMH